MKTVVVDKKELLSTLKKNRDNYRAMFEEALIGYRKLVIEKLDKAIQDAKTGKKIKTYFRIEEPVAQTPDYDRAISMLEWSLDDKIELTEHEFAQYVTDNWQWKMNFLLINSACVAKARE